MERRTLEVGELKFKLILPDDTESIPVLEIEIRAISINEILDVPKAIQLRKLLDEYIFKASDS